MSREKSSGLSLTTLLLASASAAAAALIVPMIWERGTVVASAITPIIVSLVSEALRRPVEKVKTVSVWRRTTGGEMVREPAAGVATTRAENGAERPREEPFDPLAAARAGGPPTGEDPFGLRQIESPRSRPRSRRRPVAIALVTGLLAFGIAAVVVTASELTIFGDSVSRPKPHDVLRWDAVEEVPCKGREEAGREARRRHADAVGDRDSGGGGHADADADADARCRPRLLGGEATPAPTATP